MSSMRPGYARVSRPHQTTAQQEEALRQAGSDQIVVETASGVKRDRPRLAGLMAIAPEGDHIVIWKLDRLPPPPVTPHGGTRSLRVACVGDPDGVYHVAVAVSDTGIGMMPETMTKLFLVFTQADDSISRRFGGSGLGLAISRRLAQAMGGDIESSEFGVGSCFRITFTAAAAAPMLTAEEPADTFEAPLPSAR